MRTNLLILVLVALIGLGAGYWLGQELVETETEVCEQNPLESKAIQNWSASAIGTVASKGENSLKIEAKGESIDVLTTLKTTIKKALIEEGEKKIEEIGFKDVKVGDDVNVQIGVAENGDIWAVSITVLPK